MTAPKPKPKSKKRPENPTPRELAEAMFRAADRKIKRPARKLKPSN